MSRCSLHELRFHLLERIGGHRLIGGRRSQPENRQRRDQHKEQNRAFHMKISSGCAPIVAAFRPARQLSPAKLGGIPMNVARSRIVFSAGIALALLLQGAAAQTAPVATAASSEEKHLRNIRQLTFGGQNAEAYFSPDGKKLI